MKPLPEAVQRAFPCAPDRLTERPWWRLVATECGVSTYCRVDEKMAYAPSPRNLMPTAEVDAAYPLPHPGYRAGQVWADDVGDSVVVTHVRGGWVWLSEGDDAWSPAVFARAWPYLMADPSCPHLAPWSPAEVKS